MDEKRQDANREFLQSDEMVDGQEIKDENDSISQLENLPELQAAATTAGVLKQNCIGIAKTIEPLLAAVKPYCNGVGEKLETTASISNITHAIKFEGSREPMTKTLTTIIDLAKPLLNSNVLAVINSANKTPELLNLQTQLKNNIITKESESLAVFEYLNDFKSKWNKSLGQNDIVRRSIAAQNFAVVRIFPQYRSYDLPRGSKTVLKSLTKSSAEKLTKTEDILFDPKEKFFFHRASPEKKVTVDQVKVVESSQILFSDISFDELISFESQLYEDVTFALHHPVGKKIFEIISGWNNFINFDADIYYHARKLEEGQAPFLDHEMMMAPANISAHGRYNAIGKSCYYIAETKKGALCEISKHSGRKKIRIQVVGLRPVKSAKIIDLSEKIKGINRFIEHLRLTVENENGKIVRNYLLPNFVASCCKRLGIDGIKYNSGEYNCCVLWKDDYFEFIEGSREIVEPEGSES